MSAVATRLTRMSMVVLLVVAPWLTAPRAAGVTPPPVDSSMLPDPRPAAPPFPTEQSRPCVVAAASTPTDVTGGQLKDVDLESVWRLTRGAGQTVAVIDTGVTRHRLLPHLVPGGDYVSGGDGTDDCDGHGTVVAGIVGASPSADDPEAFSGVAPDVTIVAIRQSSNRFRATDDPAGSGFGDVDTLARAVRGAADMGATVINVSSVACVGVDAGLDDRALGAALSYAVDVKNVVVVAAAGNVGAPGQCPDQNPAADVKVVASPAWYDDYVVTVGSVAPGGAPSSFSLTGPWVDVAAPGEAVVSLDSDGEGLIDRMPDDQSPLAGTSYAAPVVAGVVALMRSRSPELTARQVMERITRTARHPAAGWNPAVGYGTVDVLAAVTEQGNRPRARDDQRPPVVSIPPPRPRDNRSAHLAVRGSAVCLAVAIAVAAMTLSANRLRRRPEGIPHD